MSIITKVSCEDFAKIIDAESVISKKTKFYFAQVCNDDEKPDDMWSYDYWYVIKVVYVDNIRHLIFNYCGDFSGLEMKAFTAGDNPEYLLDTLGALRNYLDFQEFDDGYVYYDDSKDEED